jgi:hypothetical protein
MFRIGNVIIMDQNTYNSVECVWFSHNIQMDKYRMIWVVLSTKQETIVTLTLDALKSLISLFQTTRTITFLFCPACALQYIVTRSVLKQA